MALPAALLFDMDGTVVDTEKYWEIAEHAFFEDRGVHWTSEMGRELTGMSMADSVSTMAKKSGLELDMDDTIAEMNSRVRDLVLEHGAPWLPGALESVQLAHDLGIRTALVTSSWTVFVDAVLERCPKGLFDAVVTGDQVDHGKPHPQPYQMAADLLGATGNQCMAFEDSPSGVHSALAAGAMTFVVPGDNPVPEDLGVTFIDSLEVIDHAWISRYWNA